MNNLKYELFKNVHEHLKVPDDGGETYLTTERYSYYHYCCDGFNDVGFGCGYRTIQSICSMLKTRFKSNISVPSIHEIQEILVKIGDKERKFIGSREWIGSIEASYIFDEIFNVSSVILHISKNENIFSKKDKIVTYFKDHGGLIFLGGDTDASAKLITGIHTSSSKGTMLQVVDPHYCRIPKNVDELINQSYVKWFSQTDFVDTSFYNFCMPKLS